MDLRVAVVWETVQQVLTELAAARHRTTLDVLDIGGGTGGLAVPVARLGHRVTVVDPSPDALAALDRRRHGDDATGALPAGHLQAVQGDASDLPRLVAPDSVDLVLCHGVLEHLDDDADIPVALAGVAGCLRRGGMLSIVVANRRAAVLSRALGGHFTDASRLLANPRGTWGSGDPLPRRLDPERLIGALEAAGLRLRTLRAARVLADLVPGSLVDAEPGAAAALLDLERTLAGDPAFRSLAAALHALAAKA